MIDTQSLLTKLQSPEVLEVVTDAIRFRPVIWQHQTEETAKAAIAAITSFIEGDASHGNTEAASQVALLSSPASICKTPTEPVSDSPSLEVLRQVRDMLFPICQFDSGIEVNIFFDEPYSAKRARPAYTALNAEIQKMEGK